jgi:hypothetical protein
VIILSVALTNHAASGGASWVEWVFSGIGVAVIGWLGIWLFRRRQSGGVSQSIKSGDGSTNVQVAHLNIGTGETGPESDGDSA